MIILPSLVNFVRTRPGRPQFEEIYSVPNIDSYPEEWNTVYTQLLKLGSLSPLRRNCREAIDPRFGFFGYRIHPVTHEPRYFHGGIFLEAKKKEKVKAILPGILEYSGYGAINGYYVLVSHPDIRTADGYILHSMYCHLKKPLVKFNSYQKMLREISLGSYPEIPISLEDTLGMTANSGISVSQTGVFLQISFRKFGHTPLVVDPMRLYESIEYVNDTADEVNSENIQ